MTSETKSSGFQVSKLPDIYKLKKIIVAHDASIASEKALNDAVALAERFQAEIVIAHIRSPEELALGDEPDLYRREQVEIQAEVDALTGRLTAGGVQSRSFVRAGSVGDQLFKLCCDEAADLLLMGAYGHGSQSRQTLGSTAEQLLRVLPCPVLTYGPSVSSAVMLAQRRGPALLPVTLPCSVEQVVEAISLVRLFGDSIEVFHAIESVLLHDLRWFEMECRTVASFIRECGIKAEWSFMFGPPDRAICSRSLEIGSPFILMPLKRGKGVAGATSGNVAAHVIRLATVAVLSYRCD